MPQGSEKERKARKVLETLNLSLNTINASDIVGAGPKNINLFSKPLSNEDLFGFKQW